MVAIILALALGAIEYASAMELYRQFIYEETCQAGQMTMFIFSQLLGSKNTGEIGKATGEEGVNPGKADLKDFGWLIPFATDALSCFYEAMGYSMATL